MILPMFPVGFFSLSNRNAKLGVYDSEFDFWIAGLSVIEWFQVWGSENFWSRMSPRKQSVYFLISFPASRRTKSFLIAVSKGILINQEIQD